MPMMKELFALLEEVEERKKNSECNESCKETKGIDLRECTNEAKGYHTIIPDAVFDKCVTLMKAHASLRKALVETRREIQHTLDSLPKDEKDYAVFEFMCFSDMLKEAWDKITDLVAIHEVFTKEDLDSHARESGISLELLIKMKMFNDMVEMLHK